MSNPKPRFDIGQLVKKGQTLSKIMYYEPADGKYLISNQENLLAWQKMWIEGHRISPLF